MIIVMILGIILIGIVIAIKTGDFDYFGRCLLVSILPVCIFIGLLMCYPYNIDKKLAMYEEENLKIEEKVKNTIQGYMNYEQETYSNLVKDAELETLLIKYPELNSNTLVKQEIKIYKENNTKIKELKEKEIDKNIIGWWLFFNIGQKKEGK